MLLKTGQSALTSIALLLGTTIFRKKDSYTDVDYYLNEEAAYELENNVIPKHQLLEKISKTIIDVSNYACGGGD